MAVAIVPSARTAARENRAFLGRAVRFLAGEAGIRQFLDIGTGLPTSGNVHEVAQQEPEAIVTSPAVRDVLDFGQPTALMLVAVVLHFIPDEDKPAEAGLYGGAGRTA